VHTNLGVVDSAIILFYLVGIVSLGCWAGLRQRRGAATGADYFLAGGTLTWPVIGLALFSTNISTIHLVGFAQEGYDNGLAYGNFEWMAPFTLIITALFFAPFYIRSRVATLPDFLEMRYNRPCRDWLAVLSIVAAVFMHIGFSLYMGAVLLQGMFGLDLYFSIAATAILTGIYTIVGGLTAVVVTESIQTIILVIGAVIITIISYYHLDGGFSGMYETLEAAGELEKATVLRSADDPANLPWYAVFLGYPVIGIWYWCADQTIVQRVLGAKDENHARVGPLFCGFIKILPVFLFVLPGLMCYVLVQQQRMDPERMANVPVREAVILDGVEVPVTAGRMTLEGTQLSVAGKDWDITDRRAYIEEGVLYVDGAKQKDTKDAYGFMMRELLPIGVRGIVAAALLAALMGTVSGALNSIATLFSYDIVRRWNPKIPDHSLVRIGRITTFVAMVVAIVWSPFIERFGSMYQGITSMICYIAPPITGVFVLGVLWRRASAVAAQATLYAGSALGFIVFLLDWCKVSWWTVPPMMATFYLLVACVALQTIISLAIPHRHTAESARLVWSHPLECLQSPGWPGLGNYKLLALLLLVTMVALYIVFA
jgi:SSS family solute:Na+ symporter